MTFQLSDRAFVIAEAGTCHADTNVDERFRRALCYVGSASKMGADAIKFQMFQNPSPENMFCWIDGDETRAPRWLRSVLSVDRWHQVKEYAEEKGLMFLASVFETATVKMLTELKVEATKVASRAARDFPYGRGPKPYLVSNGMYEPRDGADVLVLQCEAQYPSTARWEGRLPGFSDHSGTPWRAIDAISRSCRLIEVHFYMDPSEAGPDLPASLTLAELGMVCDARDAFAAMAREGS